MTDRPISNEEGGPSGSHGDPSRIGGDQREAGGGVAALVTGASTGIGAAVAGELLARGYMVHAVALDDGSLDRLPEHPSRRNHALDVRDTAALRRLVSDVAPDVVVNNAGAIGSMTPAADDDPAMIDLLLDVNLRAALHATAAALPAMIARRRGHVCFTGSIAASRPTANTAVYSATKAALHTYADGLRMDLHGTGVRVTVMVPGRVETRLYDAVWGDHDAAAARLYHGIESLTPSDVARALGFALDMPAHVDITRIEIVPTAQVYGGAAIAQATPTR